MSTKNVEVFNRYYGNGVATQFSIGFPYLKREFVKVYLYKKDTDEEKVLNSDQFSFVNDSIIQYPVLPTDEILKEGDIITIQRETELGSEFEFDNQRRLFPVEVMNADDLAFQQIQELSREIKRAVRVNPTAAETPEELLQTVYDKLDSATEIAGGAISAANQAQIAADNATAAVNSAEQTLVQTQAYVDSAKVEIGNTKNTAINTINSTVAQAKADINTAVSNAESNISTIVSDAEGSITNIAVTEANKAIANAAQEATDIATANLNSYVDGTVKPSLQTYVDQAQEKANSAATSMEQAALSATAASNYASNASADAVNAAESAGLAANSASEASIHNFKNKITNCITEIPQDIKLELNNGTLTLKAGSKLYKPNGKNADDSNKFDVVVISSDIVVSHATSTGQYMINYEPSGEWFRNSDINTIYSGESKPTVSSQYAIWYDTANNIIKVTNDTGATWTAEFTLPLCLTTVTSGTLVSIDQVFNGFGYIGSTVFALPGVKGLIPNGRNADGSLKNTEFTTSRASTQTLSNVTAINTNIRIYSNNVGSGLLYYDLIKNINTNSAGDVLLCVNAGNADIESGRITSFTPKTAFHAVDWNDYAHELNSKQDIANLSQTLDDSTTKYPSNNAVKTAIDAKGGGLEIGDIGFAPLGIDEAQNKRRYLNGQVISQAQFVSFTNKIKAAIQLTPSLATSETNWQAEVTNSKLGQCGKFVIDDTAGTIRLPKVVNIQGLQDLSLMGGIKAESLPNITGEIQAGDRGFAMAPTMTGAFGSKTAGDVYYSNDSSNTTNTTYDFDASRSSLTYQDGAPVQQEAVQYPYFIQVATGVEESIDVTREIELNNPFSLLDYKWSEYELSNASWLLSNGAFHSGTVYTAVYELLLKIKNGTETKDGVSVKLSTEAYTDTDFVINTADTTFRLPVKVKLASGNRVAGNGMTLGFTNGTDFVGVRSETGGLGLSYMTTAYGSTVGAVTSGGHSFTGDETGVGLTTDPAKSGIETSSSGLKLYFYVGETIQDANVIAASQVLTKVANGIDRTVATDRETVVGWGMPDYSAAVSVDISSGNITAPYTGLYEFHGGCNAGQYFEIRVKNVLIGRVTGTQTTGETGSLMFFAKAGDSIKSSTPSGAQYVSLQWFNLEGLENA